MTGAQAVRRDDVTAAQALTWLASARPQPDQSATQVHRVIGYFLSPEQARWFVLDAEGSALGEDGQSLDLSTVFELVATDETVELRWLQHSGGIGPAVAHTTVGASPAGGSDVSAPGAIVYGEKTRRLAGTIRNLLSPAETPQGAWVQLHSARYGPVAVPAAGTPGQSIDVRTREICVTDRYGNVSVIDTHLVGLSSAPPEKESA